MFVVVVKGKVREVLWGWSEGIRLYGMGGNEIVWYGMGWDGFNGMEEGGEGKVVRGGVGGGADDIACGAEYMSVQAEVRGLEGEDADLKREWGCGGLNI